MDKSYLVIDNKFAEELGIKKYEALMPSVGFEPKWKLPFENHGKYNSSIIKTKRKLARLYAKEIFSPALGYKEESCERLFLNYGTLITYVLCDRLLRLNKVAGELDINELSLPEIAFDFDPKWTFGYFYYEKVECDPLYNQWIINRLLPNLSTSKVDASLPSKEIKLTSVEQTHYMGKQNFSRRVLRNLKNGTFLKQISTYILNIYPTIILLVSRKLNKFPMDNKNVTFLAMKEKLNTFFWPGGIMSPIESVYIKPLEEDSDPIIRRDSFEKLKTEVAEIFKEFFHDCHEEVFLPEESFGSIAKLIADQLSYITTEQAEIYCKWAIDDLSKYKGESFLADGTGANTWKSLRIFACKELSIPVIATQHSAWGGYLANGPLITEILIEGSDDYITFGWKNKPKEESSWRRQAIPLPSPMLSELEKTSGKKKFPDTKNRHVLLSLSFLYRFPSIYNSFLRLDIINDYLKTIDSIITSLNERNITVTLSFYNNLVAKTFESSLNRWKSISGDNLMVMEDHDIRLRHIMQSRVFDETYDAILWDLPAGGFSESIACGKKTFSLVNRKLIRIYPEAEKFVSPLDDLGIFFQDGIEISETLEKMYQSEDWYNSEIIQDAISEFKNEYFMTDPDWHKKWQEALHQMSNLT